MKRTRRGRPGHPVEVIDTVCMTKTTYPSEAAAAENVLGSYNRRAVINQALANAVVAEVGNGRYIVRRPLPL